jgi:hypothetical protein
VERLASYHLDSPKFTKFNDIEPLARQDIEAYNHYEREELSELDELKIDAFRAVAVVTGDPRDHRRAERAA